MADAKTVGDGIEELREICGRFVRFAGDKEGRGMVTWMQGCASLIREIIEKALAVHPDGPFEPHCQLVVGPEQFRTALAVLTRIEYMSDEADLRDIVNIIAPGAVVADEVEEITDRLGLPGGGFKVGTKLYIVYPKEG